MRRSRHRMCETPGSPIPIPTHPAPFRRALRVAGVARAPAPTDSLRRGALAHAAEESPASANLRAHREPDLLHREGAAGDAAGLLSRRQSLSPHEGGPGGHYKNRALAHFSKMGRSPSKAIAPCCLVLAVLHVGQPLHLPVQELIVSSSS